MGKERGKEEDFSVYFLTFRCSLDLLGFMWLCLKTAMLSEERLLYAYVFSFPLDLYYQNDLC